MTDGQNKALSELADLINQLGTIWNVARKPFTEQSSSSATWRQNICYKSTWRKSSRDAKSSTCARRLRKTPTTSGWQRLRMK